MNLRITLAAMAVATIALTAPAEARHRHHYRHHFHHNVYDANWNLAHRASLVRYSRHTHRRVAHGFNEAFLSHPAGCPRIAFCGCGAAVEVFGAAKRSLWLAAAWFHFPHTSPAPGMVAVRPHHVFVLRQHIEGSVWLVADFNSGGHQSRLHARSVAGYTIVNPHGGRYASL